MEKLKSLDSLNIREKKEYAVPPNWKFKPVFCLTDGLGQELYYAVAERGLLPAVEALKTANSFTLYLLNPLGGEVLVFSKKSSFWVKKMEVFDNTENLSGVIQKRGASHARKIEVLDPAGQILYTVEGPSDIPDVFHIMNNGKVVGRISKKWNEAGEEGTPRPDHFGIVFPFEEDGPGKGILLGALLLIDLLF